MENHPNLFLVSDQDFEQCVLNSTLPVIVDFTADGCPPCRVLAPIFARLSDTYHGKLRFAKMNVDQNPLVTVQQMIQGTPTLILFTNVQQSIESLLAKVSAKVYPAAGQPQGTIPVK
ncbi:MAG: thiol reductase thioredoxin [Chloroflexi bacterium]|nr:MAG: thiol reductase thioredoxin [Chloroflexota bacterium]